jgi:hypothetical protein
MIQTYGFALVEHLNIAAERDPRFRGLALSAFRAIDAVTSPEQTLLDEITCRAPHDILYAVHRPLGRGALKGMSPEGHAELQDIEDLVKQRYWLSRKAAS